MSGKQTDSAMHLEACACVLWCLRKVQTSTEVKVSATMISAIFLLMLLQINPNLTSVSHQRAHLWPHPMPLLFSLTWKPRLPCQHRPRVSNQKGLNMSLHKPGKVDNKSHEPIGGIKRARESGVR